jgi:ABC transport system ATP-binding/permease protein
MPTISDTRTEINELTEITGTIETTDGAASAAEPTEHARAGVFIRAHSLDQHVHGHQILHGVTLQIEPGEVVAIVGPSGAGKTTLLETLAGLRKPTQGTVRSEIFGADTDQIRMGFVPQEDIIHRELPLQRTLVYAAQLRLPAVTSAAVAGRVVDETLRQLDLGHRADVAVGSLSGGQRKRASIAVELLAHPQVFFLDEPTSGLDPATAGELIRLLRRLADGGTTIVLTSHSPTDIDRCDRVVFMARDGYLAFTGTADEARRYFGVDDLAQVYDRLEFERSPAEWADAHAAHVAALALHQPTSMGTDPLGVPPVSPSASPSPSTGTGTGTGTGTSRPVNAVRQWAVLTRRSAAHLLRNRLTMTVLAGSPALVVVMMATLFQAGTFDSGATTAGPAVQTVFWVAFAGFFFGLTYGLLQVVNESAILRREQRSGLRAGAYVMSKVAVLTPVLVAVSVLMLVVLWLLDRLPDAGAGVYAALLLTLVLESTAAMALGLLASALVNDAAQATLALPLICFPQVLFAGAIVPVNDMAGIGRGISHGLANRWAFESLGRSLGLGSRAEHLPEMASYHSVFTGSAAAGWLVLVLFSGVTLISTAAVLRVKARRG